MADNQDLFAEAYAEAAKRGLIPSDLKAAAQAEAPAVRTTVQGLPLVKPPYGVLSAINTELSDNGINILGQYLKTNDEVGYVVLDADASAADGQRVLADIRSLEGTIRARLLYEYKI